MILTVTGNDGYTKTIHVDDLDEAAEAIAEMSGYDADDIKSELEDTGSFDDADAEYAIGEGEDEE